MHKHHLKPRHLGGTNDPSNLIEVTIKEHATIHFARWIAYGNWQDEIAWKTLDGQIGKDEARKLAWKIKFETDPEFKEKTLKNLKKGNPWKTGKKTGPLSKETCERISKALKGKSKTAQHRENISNARLGKKFKKPKRIN